jgi:hypothetical protein
MYKCKADGCVRKERRVRGFCYAHYRLWYAGKVWNRPINPPAPRYSNRELIRVTPGSKHIGIIRALTGDMPIPQIALEFGVSDRTVYRVQRAQCLKGINV